MDENNTINENIGYFTKLLSNLENLEVFINEENETNTKFLTKSI